MAFEAHKIEGPPDKAHALAAQQRIRELGLKLEGSPMEPLVAELYVELEAKGIALRPPCFVADEWGCPDGVPAIGVPFYLVDKKLAEVEERETEELETEPEVRRILRHEAGHAFCYAHQLYQRADFRELFGPYSRPYLDDFTPQPFSRSFVRHLPGWYAQKHPDEDFAETFAVFVTPGLDWRAQYAGWPALKKLVWLEATLAELGRAAPSVVPKPEEFAVDPGLDVTLPEHYQARRLDEAAALGDVLDADLKALFGAPPEVFKSGLEPAGKFLRAQRKQLVQAVSFWTGGRTAIVRALVDQLAARADALGLVCDPTRGASLGASASALLTTLVLNHLLRGKFVEL